MYVGFAVILRHTPPIMPSNVFWDPWSQLTSQNVLRSSDSLQCCWFFVVSLLLKSDLIAFCWLWTLWIIKAVETKVSLKMVKNWGEVIEDSKTKWSMAVKCCKKCSIIPVRPIRMLLWQSIHIINAKNFLCVCVYYQTPLPFLARFGSNFEQSYE